MIPIPYRSMHRGGERPAALPIVQYWDAPDPPGYVQELTRSFAELNQTRRHILFNRQTAGEFIAQHIGGRQAAAFEACGPPAMQADYLRYCAILHYGGVWCDADFMCVRDLSALLEQSQGGELFISPRSRKVGEMVVMNGFFAFATRRHPFLRLIVDFTTELIERRWRGIVSSVTGPRVITLVYHLSLAESVEDFMHLVRRRAPTALSFAHVLCDLVDDEQLVSISEGIRARLPENRDDWIQRAGRRLPCQHPDVHWKSAGMQIYTDEPSEAADESPAFPVRRR